MTELFSTDVPIERFSIKVVNSTENWKLIDALGIVWFVDEPDGEQMTVTTNSQEDIDEVRSILESCSTKPYHGFVDY